MQLHPNETVSATIYEHWISMLGPAITVAFIVIIQLVVGLYFKFNFFGYGTIVYFLINALTAISFIYNYYIWRENNLVITNLRIIYNEQARLFNEKVTELLYRDVTEVSFTQDGPLALAYDYGTLVLRLPSDSQVTVRNIPHPAQVIELINKIRLGI